MSCDKEAGLQITAPLLMERLEMARPMNLRQIYSMIGAGGVVCLPSDLLPADEKIGKIKEGAERIWQIFYQYLI